jgi:hypothetical protein
MIVRADRLDLVDEHNEICAALHTGELNGR